ncbi:MAG TPA: hypothetical protein QF431_04615 [Acidimicrobiales bacterium]|nr:hypothetical protein [Nitrospinaceae bacterium]HJM28376.1 hypothetical protein [Acidimicrobiales bacterium]
MTVPEGHTIHRLAADLRKDFVGQPVSVDSPQGRFSEGAALVDGEQMVKSEAWGKHLFCYWESGNILHVHLGLIGKFRPASLEFPPPETVRLRLSNELKSWHLTGPQTCAMVVADDLKQIISKLGPDPLRLGARGAGRFIKGLASSKKPIGAALLDQSLLAGIGNVYRSELLYLCGIHPETPSNLLSEKNGEDLWDLTVDLLRKGRKLNRIVTVQKADEGNVPPSGNEREDSLYAYKRDGLDCRRCPNEIEISSLAGRSIWYCPQCQEKK